MIMNMSPIWKKIAVIFQDYKLFAFTVGENISCNERYKEDKKIMDLIEEVGLKEKKLILYPMG